MQELGLSLVVTNGLFSMIKLNYYYFFFYHSTEKKNKKMLFAVRWMQLEIITLSEIRKRQIPYDTTYVWNLKYLKYDKNELVCKTETNSTNRTDLWFPRGRWWRQE